MKHTTTLLIILCLITQLCLFRRCDKPKEIIHVERDTIVKTVQVIVKDTVIVNKIVPKYITVTKEVVLTSKDTAAIVEEYYKKNVYSDTLVNDERGIIRIDEEVTKNAVIWRKLYYNHINTKEVKTVTETKTLYPKPTWDLYGQVLILPSLDNIQVIPGVTLMNPNGYGAGLHYDVISHKVGVSFMYKFF